MLPAHIIHEILEQERRRRERQKDEVYIELPVGHPDDQPNPYHQEGDDPAPGQRGVVIIDFFD